MAKVTEALLEIREELRELRTLYKGLVEKLIPVEEPTEEERRAIEGRDSVAGEEELLKALGERRVHS
jgi:archaellum component FlaC